MNGKTPPVETRGAFCLCWEGVPRANPSPHRALTLALSRPAGEGTSVAGKDNRCDGRAS